MAEFTDRTEVAHNCTKPFKAPYCWIEESLFLKKIEMQSEALIVQENYLLLFELCI